MSPTGDERDAWLAQALRHAPDANADAPPLLSDTILREARAATLRPVAARVASRPDLIGPLLWVTAVWNWLARPPVAAGFASVMVVTLVGVMWWDKPLDEAMPRAPAVVSSTPPARAEATPAPASLQAQAEPAAPATPKPGMSAGNVAAPGRLVDRKVARKTPFKSAADTATAAAPAPAPIAFAASGLAPSPRAAATANEATAPQGQLRESTTLAAKAPAESSAPAAADKAASPRNDRLALQGAAEPAALAKARAGGAGAAPLANLRARIAQQPERWRWQRGPGSKQAMNASVQGWLAEVDRLTAPHWQASPGSSAREPAHTLRLFRDGVLQAILGLAGNAVWFEVIDTSPPTASVAALPEGAAESLRQTLGEATP